MDRAQLLDILGISELDIEDRKQEVLDNPYAREVIEKFVWWYNWWVKKNNVGLPPEDAMPIAEMDEFFAWGETRILNCFQNESIVLVVLTANNGDDGGGNRLIALFNSDWLVDVQTYELAWIVQEFDAESEFIYRNNHFIMNGQEVRMD